MGLWGNAFFNRLLEVPPKLIRQAMQTRLPPEMNEIEYLAVFHAQSSME
jgi:hypothetical protein